MNPMLVAERLHTFERPSTIVFACEATGCNPVAGYPATFVSPAGLFLCAFDAWLMASAACCVDNAAEESARRFHAARAARK